MAGLPTKAKRVSEVAGTAFAVKGDLNQLWQDFAELHQPEQADFTKVKDPDQFGSELYDSTPALNRRDFGNWLSAVLRPKGRDWFRGKFRDFQLNEHQMVKAFTQMQDRAHRGLLYDDRSNFIGQVGKADHDYSLYGNSATYIDKRSDGTGFAFKTCHLRDCAWQDDDDGNTDTFFRKMTLPVKSIVANEKRRNWTVPERIKTLMEKEMNRKIEILHVCMPSDHYHQTSKPRFKDREHIILYICVEFNCVFYEEEVHEFRYQVSRWFRLSGSPYAISPAAMVSQPDARTMQSMAWSIMQAGELAVEPPTIATSEAVLSPINLFAGGTTWVDKNYDEKTGRALTTVDMGKMPDIGIALHQGMKETMGDAWYLNKLMLPEVNHEQTAQEIERLYEQFLRVTQPIIEPAEPERNGSLLAITHSMAWHAGWMKMEMPEELEGKDMSWTYDNPIEDARQKGLLGTFQQSMELTMAASQLDPTINAAFDVKTAHRDTMSVNAPAKWLLEKDSDELKEKEEQAAKQAQEAQMTEQAAEGAEIAEKANNAGLL